jgi:ABC-type transporter Mla subunit MlaD
VLFNGIRVGEVTALRISADRPNEVHAEIELDAGTPVRNNTIVDIE